MTLTHGGMTSVGITATRSGLTLPQFQALGSQLAYERFAWKVEEFHHGDCVGGDLEGAQIAQHLGFVTIAHPPANERLRAFHPSDRVLSAQNYHDRNRTIVHRIYKLFGCPDGPRRKGSGTWYTIDYALSLGRPTTVIMPDGTVS